MKYCIHCGQKLEDHAEYCSRCGQKQSGPMQKSVQVSSTNSTADVEMIRKYLKGAVEIEWNLYGLSRIKEGLVAQLNKLIDEEAFLKRSAANSRNRISSNENQIRTAEPEEYSGSSFGGFEIGYDSSLYLFVSFGFWIVCFLLWAFNYKPAISIMNWFLDFVSGIRYGQILYLVVILLLPTLFVFVIQFLYGLIKVALHGAKESGKKAEFDQKAAQRLEQRKAQLRKEINDLNQSIRSDENKVSRLHNTIIPALEKEIVACNGQIDKAEQKRISFYSVKLLYPKYQALVPVCTMFEYFDSGRVDTLTGHTGAYNLYENELRLNIIVDKLTEISAKLDRISSNQQAILSRLNSLNSRVNGLMNSVETANRNYISSTAAVSSQITQLQYSADLNNYYAKENQQLLQQLKEIRKADYQSHTFF